MAGVWNWMSFKVTLNPNHHQSEPQNCPAPTGSGLSRSIPSQKGRCPLSFTPSPTNRQDQAPCPAPQRHHFPKCWPAAQHSSTPNLCSTPGHQLWFLPKTGQDKLNNFILYRLEVGLDDPFNLGCSIILQTLICLNILIHVFYESA